MTPGARASSILLLVLALASGLVAPRGLVLCIAEESHVAIEGAVEIVPCDPAFGTPPGPSGSEAPEACIDLPLVPASIGASSGSAPAAAPAVWIRAPLAVSARGGAVRLDCSLRVASDGRALRTIVLLV